MQVNLLSVLSQGNLIFTFSGRRARSHWDFFTVSICPRLLIGSEVIIHFIINVNKHFKFKVHLLDNFKFCAHVTKPLQTPMLLSSYFQNKNKCPMLKQTRKNQREISILGYSVLSLKQDKFTIYIVTSS